MISLWLLVGVRALDEDDRLPIFERQRRLLVGRETSAQPLDLVRVDVECVADADHAAPSVRACAGTIRSPRVAL